MMTETIEDEAPLATTIPCTFNAGTLSIAIDALDGAAVPVTFTEGEIVHSRSVNACMVDGELDVAATIQRVADVARGVAVKISLGVIREMPAVPEAPAGDGHAEGEGASTPAE